MTDFVWRYREHVERLAQAVLTTTGETDVSLRQAVEARAAALGGGTALPPNEAVPASLDRYVGKVGLHAYQVTDADVETLKAVAYSEDAIFEITLSAALASQKIRLFVDLSAAVRTSAPPAESRQNPSDTNMPLRSRGRSGDTVTLAEELAGLA